MGSNVLAEVCSVVRGIVTRVTGFCVEDVIVDLDVIEEVDGVVEVVVGAMVRILDPQSLPQYSSHRWPL